MYKIILYAVKIDTLADTYSPATVSRIYGRHTLLCCVSLSPKLTSPDVVSVTQLLPSGTHSAVCNSLPRTVLESPSITVFKSRLKTKIICSAYFLSTVESLCVRLPSMWSVEQMFFIHIMNWRLARQSYMWCWVVWPGGNVLRVMLGGLTRR